MSFCENCFKGVRHEGIPEGETVQIGGVKCYVATPAVDYPKDKVLLFLTDAFGLALVNNLLLADDFARNGFMTIVPDIFSDDPVPVNIMEPGAPAFDGPKWFAKHGPEVTRPLIDKVIAALKHDGVTGFGATGYCFGARYVVNLAIDGVTKASAISHPTGLAIPGDLERYRDQATAPLLINSCPVDQMFPPEAQAQADAILGEGKFVPGYKREYFEGCEHGFAVRGDMSDPKVKAGKEGAFKASVEWLLKYT